jgi:hypothetical protein
MTDDRSLERAARSWLEEGPTRAPERPVDAALARIQTTSQELELRIPWVAWRPRTMFDRLAVTAVSAVLAIGALTLGASLISPPDNASRPCPATFDEGDAIDTFTDGLSQAQRAWGIAGGSPGNVRPGAIAAFAADPANAPLAVITIDPVTGRQCPLVRLVDDIVAPPATSLDWSPSGDALAIGIHEPDLGGGPDRGQVLIWTADRLFRVWSGDGTPGLEWAPDGGTIAVWKAWPLGLSDPESDETRVIHADGSPDRTYRIRPFTDGLHWSPDGSRWLVSQGTTTFDPTSVSVVEVGDGRTTPIALAPIHFNAMGWIDDGRVLLREVTDPGVRYVEVRLPPADPAELSILPIHDDGPTYESYELALSPDGRRIAYATAGSLEILDLAEGPAGQPVSVDVVGAAGDVGLPSWSPDSTHVLFGGAGAFWVVDANGAGLRQLVGGNIHPIDDPWQPVPVR